MGKKEEQEKVIQLNSDYVEVETYYYGRTGSNDYTKRSRTIEKIVDREGKSHKVIKEENWTEISSGIETCKKDYYISVVRINRKACPVRMLWCSRHEYVSYDSSEHNSQETDYYWVRYEA